VGRLKVVFGSEIYKVSKATATRDLQYLNSTGALLVSGGGRSTICRVNILFYGFNQINFLTVFFSRKGYLFWLVFNEINMSEEGVTG